MTKNVILYIELVIANQISERIPVSRLQNGA